MCYGLLNKSNNYKADDGNSDAGQNTLNYIQVSLSVIDRREYFLTANMLIKIVQLFLIANNVM